MRTHVTEALGPGPWVWMENAGGAGDWVCMRSRIRVALKVYARVARAYAARRHGQPLPVAELVLPLWEDSPAWQLSWGLREVTVYRVSLEEDSPEGFWVRDERLAHDAIWARSPEEAAGLLGRLPLVAPRLPARTRSVVWYGAKALVALEDFADASS